MTSGHENSAQGCKRHQGKISMTVRTNNIALEIYPFNICDLIYRQTFGGVSKIE